MSQHLISSHLSFVSMPGGMEWLLILLVALLVFGKNLPQVMRDLGRSVRTFKEGMGMGKDVGDDLNPFAPRHGHHSQPRPPPLPIDQDFDHLLPPQRRSDTPDPRFPDAAPSAAQIATAEADVSAAADPSQHNDNHGANDARSS